MAIEPEHRVQQTDRVLMAARKCFIQHGFHASGMAEIAKACRMSAGNIYHYFPHKDAIVQAITDEIHSRLLRTLRLLADHQDPVDGLIGIMGLSLQEICSDSNARLWMEIAAEAPRNKVIRNIWMRFDMDLRQLLERLLSRAVQAGQLPPDTDVEATSLWLVALLDGAITRLSVQPDFDLGCTQATLTRNIRRFIRLDKM